MGGAGRKMSNARTIRKYRNRRLYDTHRNQYVTQSDLRALVLENVQFEVIAASSNDDVTRETLLQILVEEERGAIPLFSASLLAQLIRFYGGTMQDLSARFLEESLNLFSRQQAAIEDSLALDPIDVGNQLARQNLEIWNRWQASVLGLPERQALAARNDSPSKRDGNKSDERA